MKKTLILISMISCLCLTGCRGQELRLVSIVTGMGIDRAEEGYAMTFETGSGMGQDGKGITPAIMNGKGETLTRCMADVQRQSGRYPYMRHAVLLALSYDAVDENLENLLNYAINEHNLRLSANVAVVPEKAAEIFNDKEFAGSKVVRSMSKGATTITTASVTLSDLLYDVYSDGIDAFLPIVSKEKTEGVELFCGFDRAASLDARLTPVFLLAKGKAGTGSVTVEVDGRPYSFKLADSCSSVKAEAGDGGVSVTVDIEGEFRAEDKLEEGDEVYAAALEKRLESDMGEVIAVMKQTGSDPLGIGQYICRRDNGLWREMKDDWGRVYGESRWQVNVDVKIDSAGRIREGK